MCLFASVAHADIIRVSPTSFDFGNSEEFLTIYGFGLHGTVATHVRFVGPPGEFVVEISSQGSEQSGEFTVQYVTAYVPGEVATTSGEYSVYVLSIDENATREHGPATITIGPGPVNAPPLLFVPEIVGAEAETADGAMVHYEVVAMNADGSPLDVSCSPGSGRVFPIGTSSVSCQATNAAGTTRESFLVVVTDTVAPVLTLPEDFTTASTEVTFLATALDAINGSVPVNCTPQSGTTFAFGETTVTCFADDLSFNGVVGSFKVTVVGGPAISVPDDFSVEGTYVAGALVNYVVSATENGVVTCAPASGTQFAFGDTTVNCTATNSIGSSTGSFVVSVIDKTPPTLTLPGNITVEPASPDGTVVSWTATATDPGEPGELPVYCFPESGSLFPIGLTEVVCYAEDSTFQAAIGTFTVNVADDVTPPVLSLPADITTQATSPAGAVVTFTVSATDDKDGDVPVSCTRTSGETFALGTTVVACSATDAAGNTANGSFRINVVDTLPPTVTSATVTPTKLWPPNHKMANAVVSITATDAVDPNPVSKIISISSNQPLNGTGDGDVDIDWIITGPLTAQLRAERSHGQDRIYTIKVQTKDSSGNVTLTTLTVRVTNK